MLSRLLVSLAMIAALVYLLASGTASSFFFWLVLAGIATLVIGTLFEVVRYYGR